MQEELVPPEEDENFLTELPPGVTEEDLEQGPDPDPEIQHTRTPVIDIEAQT